MYEAILERELDKRNFRRKFKAIGIVKGSGKKRQQEDKSASTTVCFLVEEAKGSGYPLKKRQRHKSLTAFLEGIYCIYYTIIEKIKG